MHFSEDVRERARQRRLLSEIEEMIQLDRRILHELQLILYRRAAHAGLSAHFPFPRAAWDALHNKKR
jgi:hypothetical protein